MAMAAVQYPQAAPIPETHPPSQSLKLSRYDSPIAPVGLVGSSSSLFAYSNLQGLSRTGTSNSLLDDPDASDSNVAALAAAKLSDFGYSRPQKRASIGSTKSESKQRSMRKTTSTQTSSIVSSDHPVLLSQQSTNKAIAKDRFKMNLRKLSQPKRDDDQPTLDLSKSLEENERQSGLGISLRDYTSQPFYQLNSSTAFQSHSRNVSYNSQSSMSPISFKPSTPFTFNHRPPPLPSTPSPEPISYPTGLTGADDPYSMAYIPEDVGIESSPTSTRPKPFPLINRVGSNNSASRFGAAESSQSIKTSNSQTRSTGRPRRSTNQSMDTIGTPKSHSSLDRALSLITRGSTADKSEPMDPVTRAASIQAARQAFEDHEMAKAKKQERREQKAADKATKRRTKGMGTRKSGFQARSRSRSRTRSSAKPTTEAVGIAYSSMPAGPTPRKGEGALTGKQNTTTRQKRSVLKNRYLRFVSWLRSKFLKGRQRRRPL